MSAKETPAQGVLVDDQMTPISQDSRKSMTLHIMQEAASGLVAQSRDQVANDLHVENFMERCRDTMQELEKAQKEGFHILAKFLTDIMLVIFPGSCLLSNCRLKFKLTSHYQSLGAKEALQGLS